MQRNLKLLAAVAATGTAFSVPAIASAHVTLQPSEAEAGGYTVLNVRVPNEEDDRGTTKVDLQMPDGFEFASYEKVPGWTTEVTRSGDQVSRVTFSGGVIEPGQFRDFPLSVKIPDGETGSKLTFKALQTYEGGEVVRWIGAPDAEKPAPQVTLTSASESEGAAAAPTAAPSRPVAASTGPAADDDADTLTIVALIVGALGLLAGLAALRAGTRQRSPAM